MRNEVPRLAVVLTCMFGLALGVTVRLHAQSAPAPMVTAEPDHWHVEASLPGSTDGVATFVWVVKTGGMSDAYFLDKTAPFLIDPFTYGGKTVSVSARGSGHASNPWAAPIQVNVPPP